MPTKNEMKQLFDETRAKRDSLKSKLARAAQEKDELAQSLKEMEAELVTACKRLNIAQEEIGRVGEAVEVIEELQDKVERLEWERDEADKGHEVSLLLARENIRKELAQTHQELEMWDYLIQLLRRG